MDAIIVTDEAKKKRLRPCREARALGVSLARRQSATPHGLPFGF
jgi:hypothetical protein